jgi:hypothetical protein
MEIPGAVARDRSEGIAHTDPGEIEVIESLSRNDQADRGG